MKYRIIFFIAVLTLLSIIVGPAAQAQTTDSNDSNESINVQTTIQSLDAQAIDFGISEEEAIYLIRLEDPPLVAYKGDIDGFSPTSPMVIGGGKLDATSLASRAYTNYLMSQQSAAIAAIENALGRSLVVTYQYYVTNNGLAATMTGAEAERIAKMPQVIFIQKDFERELMTDNGPAWIGAPSLWDGTNTGGLPGTKGEGIIVGVIDTGINPSNPSFTAVGPIDGYVHINPLGSGNYVGVCDSTEPTYDATFPCNNKLIGAWGYLTHSNEARDNDGHGSHTASTAAGNIVTATVSAPSISLDRRISGVAPHANIISYAACCNGSDLTAAIEQIVLDGVDVVNYSIGSTAPSNPWTDFDTAGYLNARNAGVFVATSAGNAGPGDETMGSPADAPWLLSVGATTHDRQFVDSLINMSGGATAPPSDMTGAGITGNYGPETIVYAGDYGFPLCGTGPSGPTSNPWLGNIFGGKIVVCDRGTYGRVEKGENVLAAGAGGYILANDIDNGNSVVADPHALPAVHISYDAGVILKAWLASGTGHVGTITGTTIDTNASYGDIMAGFSSRGANRALPDMVGPSVSAPGVDILAAYGTNDAVTWDISSGTSMASPHAAGAAALLVALHPNWTPAQVQSALMTTAETAVLDNDGSTSATPFDMGNGRIDLTQASKAGLVLDETYANYLAANPATGGDPKTLNIPSMGNSQCFGICSWTRVVSSTQIIDVDWTASVDLPTGMIISVTPTSFTLPAGGTQAITITANVQGAAVDQWNFGQVILTPSDNNIPNAHFPVAVYPIASSSSDGATLTKTADTSLTRINNTINYTVTVDNPSFTVQTYSLIDPIPANSSYVPASATGGLVYDGGQNHLTWSGAISAAAIAIDDSTSLSGYVSMGGLGVAPLGDPGNDSCWLVSVPDFYFQGQSYNEVIMSENGTIEPGSASLSCLGGTNVEPPLASLGFPYPLLIPFWDDLDVSTGNWYAASGISYNGKSHIVLSWEGVNRQTGQPSSYSFQVWIEEGTDNIWFTYGTLSGTTNSATIGFQNTDGTQGVSYRHNNTGTLPDGSVDLVIDYITNPQTFTFQLTADSGPDITNVVTATYGTTDVTATAYTVVGDANSWLGNSTNWHTDNNWSLNRVPIIFDDAIIPTTPSGGNMPALSNSAAVYSLALQPDATLDLSTYSFTAEMDVTNNGTLTQQVSNVPSGSTTEFLHIQDSGGATSRYRGVEISPTSGDMDSTIVSVRGNSECTTVDLGSPDTVNRCFYITPTAQQTADVRFYYLDGELDGHDPNSLDVWHWSGSSPWTLAGTVSLRNTDGIYRWIDTTGVSAFSPFTLSDGVPTAVSLQAFGPSTNLNIGLLLAVVLLLTGILFVFVHRNRKA